MKLSKSQFRFETVSVGHCKVFYTSPSGRIISKILTSQYYDDVKYEEEPTQKSMKSLRKAIFRK